MKKMKLAVFFIAIFSVVLFAPSYVEAYVSGNYEYGLYGGANSAYAGTPYESTAIIKKYTGKAKEVTLPTQIDGIKVTTVSSGVFKDNSTIVSVTIPEGILSVEGVVFNNCKNLTIVTLPESIAEIKSKSLYTNCPKLKDIKMPDGMEKMPDGTYRSVQHVNYTVTYDYDTARDCYNAVNNYRKNDAKIGTLELNYELSEAAMKRAAELALHFDHTRPSGLNSGTILYNVASAENIFYCGGYTTGDSMFNAWKSSSGHKKQLDNADYKSTGIGVVIVNKQTFAVQIFSRSKSTDKRMNSGKKDVLEDIMVSKLYDCFYLEVLGLDKNINLASGGTTKASEVKIWNHPRTSSFSSVRSYVSVNLSNVIWKSSDENVFKVDKNGTITGVKPGSATLKAIVGSQELDYTVNVTTLLNQLYITNGRPVTILIGAEQELNVANTTNTNTEELSWTTDNESVLSVTKGTIKAVGAGAAKVTVSTSDGIKDTIDVIVKKPNVLFGKEVITIVLGKRNSPLDSYAEIGSEEIEWQIENPDIVAIDGDGNIIPLAIGETKVTAISGDGTISSCTIKVTDHILGDMDGNGVVNGTDASIILTKYSLNTITERDVEIGDMDGNGVLNGTDASMILDIYNRGL